MDFTMNQEIRDAIERNLPQALGSALQDRLKKAGDDAAEVQRLRGVVQEKDAKIVSLMAETADLNNQLARHESLDKREADIAKRERDAENASLKIQLEAAQVNATFARGVALGLVRNIEYRNSVHRSESGSLPVPGSNGGYPTTMPTQSTVTTTTENTAA